MGQTFKKATLLLLASFAVSETMDWTASLLGHHSGTAWAAKSKKKKKKKRSKKATGSQNEDREPTSAPDEPVDLTPSAGPLPAVQLDRIEGRTLYFTASGDRKPPAPLQLELWEMKPVGWITEKASTEPPFFLLSGRSCKDCQQDNGIFLVHPSSSKTWGFVYPGRLIDHRNRNVVMESRGFYGRCLAGNPHEVLVLFQKERVDRKNKLQQSVLVAEMDGVRLRERLLERVLPRIETTLKLVRAKACREIDGRNRMTLSKPLDVNLGYRNADSDNDEDESPRENQTDRDASGSDGAVLAE